MDASPRFSDIQQVVELRKILHMVQGQLTIAECRLAGLKNPYVPSTATIQDVLDGREVVTISLDSGDPFVSHTHFAGEVIQQGYAILGLDRDGVGHKLEPMGIMPYESALGESVWGDMVSFVKNKEVLTRVMDELRGVGASKALEKVEVIARVIRQEFPETLDYDHPHADDFLQGLRNPVDIV